MESEDESDFEDFSEPSSSPNLSDDDDGEDDGDARMARAAARGIQPYLFEPLADAPRRGRGLGTVPGKLLQQLETTLMPI